MSSISRPPGPCLVAVMLVVSSRLGPRFVYHYPPNPSTANSTNRRGSRTKSGARSTDSVHSSDGEGSSSDEDDHGLSAVDRAASSVTLSALSGGLDALRSSVNHGSSTSLTQKRTSASADIDGVGDPLDEGQNTVEGDLSEPPWDRLLGLPTYIWEKLLSPSPAWHKRRFQAGINDLAIVGWPVFVREDGTWRKRKRKKKAKKSKRAWEGGGLGHEDPAADDSKGDDSAERASSFDGLPESESRDSEDDEDAMMMFNVVFVMNPPLQEYHMRIKEKYDNVIKKFGKGLKCEQARAGYVWTEAQMILHIKEKARENKSSLVSLYSELLSKSSLARAMSIVFNNISTSRIASVTFSEQASMSLQVPPLTSTSYLPTAADTAYPGLWLTTANRLSATDDSSSPESSGSGRVLAKNFALLLLDDQTTILRDVQASVGALGPPLAHYIRSSKPTKSFAQISTQSSIPLSDIQLLANHLVYWRRARAVPPLNKRDTYIVSPNADMSELAHAAVAYEGAFPALPTLPKMLAALSGPPRPYATLIPSRDHKQRYYDILAWLLRGGWVTQLRTFGWIKVGPEIKMAVAEAMAKEKKTQASSVSSSDGERVDETGDDHSSSPSSSQDGDVTPVPDRHDRLGILPSKPLITRHTTSSLILFPHRASPTESRWLNQILSTFPEPSTADLSGVANDPDDAESDTSLQKYWPVFTKYFNGTDALEKIPVREGLSRKVVWRLLTRMMNLGPGHPGHDASPSEKVLVAVRHW